MAATVETKLWLALKARIETLPLGFSIAWPKEDFTPVAGQPYLKVTHTLTMNERPFIGNSDPQFRQGILQVGLHTPVLPQPAETDIQYAGQISAHFWANPTLIYEDVKVRIQRAPDVGNAYRVENYWFTPTNIPWESFA